MTYAEKIIHIINNIDNIKILSEISDDIKYSSTIKLLCTKHNMVITKKAEDIIRTKHPCQKCSKELQIINTKKKNYEKFIQKSKEKFKDQFTYFTFEESKFDKMNLRVKLHCNKHNLDFECEPNSHLESPVGACPQCVYNYRYGGSRINPLINNVHDINSLQKISDEKFGWYTILTYNNSWYKKCTILCNKHNIEFDISPYYHVISESGACPICYQENNVMFKNESKTQIEISNYVKSLIGANNVNDNKSILRYKNSLFDVDIYVPKYNLAIEYDGLLWHSYGKSKYPSLNNYNKLNRGIHKLKTDLAEKQGIQLLRIWENEWKNPTKQDIWKSIIKLKLNRIDRKIYARNCKIKKISRRDAVDFLSSNHLQGFIDSKIYLGLFYNNELVSVMSFSKSRYTDHNYELMRFASKINTIVIGGASKLLKYFIKEYNPDSIISYANRRWSNGNLYKKLGFTEERITEPNYYYVEIDNLMIYSRIRFQKHKLKNIFNNFDPNLSEIENVINNGYRIIFDSGNYRFIWKKDNERV